MGRATNGVGVDQQPASDVAGARPGARRRYVPVTAKFMVAQALAVGWLALSVWLSLPWVREPAAITVVPAVLVVCLVAYLPGWLVAFLAVSLLLDRQPPLRTSAATMPVTVLIAARNEADRIQQTIAYIARQDYPGPIEVLVVDNGSTDGTRAVAEAYGAATGQPVRCIGESRPGKSHALNAGLTAVGDRAGHHRRRRHPAAPSGRPPARGPAAQRPGRRAGRRRIGAGPQQSRQPLDADAGMGLLPRHRVGEADAGVVPGHAGRPGSIQPLPHPGGPGRRWLARRDRRGHRAHLAAHAPGRPRLLRALRGRLHRRPGQAAPPGPPAGPLGAGHDRGHPECEALEPATSSGAVCSTCSGSGSGATRWASWGSSSPIR